MTTWTDQLEVLDAPSLFPSEAQDTRNAAISLPADLRHASKVERRRYLNALHISNAARHLDQLPAPGESLHCVMKGNFPGFALVGATLRLIAPATIERLDIATLGFSKDNVTELLQMLDSGQIGKVTFLCSCYFKSMADGAEIYDALVRELHARGHTIGAARNHAKIILMQTTGGDHYVVESSANLRSCRNVEAFVMSNDRELLAFHRRWMMHLLTETTQ